MKSLNGLARYRVTTQQVIDCFGSVGDHRAGVFEIPSPVDRVDLMIIAASSDRWDHVSVSRRDRCPTWDEMDHIKRMFFKPDETAMQLHLPISDHISIHPHCLHIWMPHDSEIPRPPSIMVGPS